MNERKKKKKKERKKEKKKELKERDRKKWKQMLFFTPKPEKNMPEVVGGGVSEINGLLPTSFPPPNLWSSLFFAASIL